MRLLIYSDLHLETYPSFKPILDDGSPAEQHADMVILAGDIHQGIRGLQWARESFPEKPIIYVAGNHELWDGHWERTVEDLRAAATKLDIEFLECGSVDAGGLRFLGATLWTDFRLLDPSDDSMELDYMRFRMNDYRRIAISNVPELLWADSKHLVPELTVERHRASVQWLERELKKSDPQKTVVISHHAPLGKSIPSGYKTARISAAYGSDLSRLMGMSKVWIHGHIHSSVDYEANGTRILSNPRGRISKQGGPENAGFQPGLIVEI